MPLSIKPAVLLYVMNKDKRVMPFLEKKVPLVKLGCGVAFPMAFVSCDLCSYFMGASLRHGQTSKLPKVT